MLQQQYPGPTASWRGGKLAQERTEWNVVHICFYQCNCCFSITSLAHKPPSDPPQQAHSHHLSLTSKSKSIQLDQRWQLAADAGGHTPLHSHNGPWHNWGPRNRQHSRSFQEASCLQVTSNTACPCLSALSKRKECFPPQHGCVGIKAHSEWPRVVQQMLARIALVAVPTVSRRDRPTQTTLSLWACMGEKGVKGRFCHTL